MAITGPLILCCGNPDRGDDAAGPLAAARLLDLGIHALPHAGESLSLLDAWRGAQDVIVIDAVVTGAKPGAVSVWDALRDPPATPPRPASSHSMGLAEAVALARLLDCLPGRLTVYGIEAEHFDFGSPASQAVQRGAAQVARQIYEYCTHSRRAAV